MHAQVSKMHPIIDVLRVNPQTVTKVGRRFNRSEKSLDDDVAVLEKWIKSQPHLPQLLDTHSLRNFLFINKCSVEVTKQKIDNYYTIRSRMPHIFREINPKRSDTKGLNEAIYMVVYPELTDEMYKLTYFKIKNENLQDKYEVIHVIRRFLTLQELRLREDIMCGDVFIVDLLGVQASTILKISPVFIYRNLLQVYGQIFSFRFKGLYLVNVPSFFTTIMDSLKMFVKPKLLERVHIESDMESLKKHLPLNMLPKEFGGEGLSLDLLQDALEAKYEQQQELFDRLDKIEIDENLRPGKLEDNDILGFYGNFKSLEID